MTGMWRNIPTDGQNRGGGSKHCQRNPALKLHLLRCRPKRQPHRKTHAFSYNRTLQKHALPVGRDLARDDPVRNLLHL